MLSKLKALREEREEGFTLIELLVVILIIGILAAIAIPVFLNQRMTANDGAVESDVKNVATQVESWIVGEKGKATAISAASFADAKASTGVKIVIKGDANNYCIKAGHENGKQYKTATAATAATAVTTILTYDNALGGIGKGVPNATASTTNPCSGTTGWLTVAG